MKNKAFIMLVIAFAIIFSIGLALIYGWKSPLTFKIATTIIDQKTYGLGDSVKVEIRSNVSGTICFSSCYPYYFEKKDGEGWKSTNYPECSDKNVASNCVSPRQLKAFQISDPGLDAGTYRLAIPLCLGCSVSQDFKEDKRIYSDEFIVR